MMQPISRRELLQSTGMGFGWTAGLVGLLAAEGRLVAGAVAGPSGTTPLAPREPHFAPRARQVRVFVAETPEAEAAAEKEAAGEDATALSYENRLRALYLPGTELRRTPSCISIASWWRRARAAVGWGGRCTRIWSGSCAAGGRASRSK